jgi:Flp pilus assembly protein TadD
MPCDGCSPIALIGALGLLLSFAVGGCTSSNQSGPVTTSIVAGATASYVVLSNGTATNQTAPVPVTFVD